MGGQPGGLRPILPSTPPGSATCCGRRLELPDELLAEGQAIPAGLKATLPEHGETLRPDVMLVAPGTAQPRLLIQVYPAGQSLDKTLPDRRWKASPATRMMELLHADGRARWGW